MIGALPRGAAGDLALARGLGPAVVGVTAYWAKPLDLTMLGQTVSTAVGGERQGAGSGPSLRPSVYILERGSAS